MEVSNEQGNPPASYCCLLFTHVGLSCLTACFILFFDDIQVVCSIRLFCFTLPSHLLLLSEKAR
jgi:hypothetical protein